MSQVSQLGKLLFIVHVASLFVPVARLMSQVVTDPLNRATWKASDGCPGSKFICTSTKNAWTICHQLWLRFTTGKASVVASLLVYALRMLNKLRLTPSTREASVGSPCRKFTGISIKNAYELSQLGKLLMAMQKFMWTSLKNARTRCHQLRLMLSTRKASVGSPYIKLFCNKHSKSMYPMCWGCEAQRRLEGCACRL